MPHGTHEELLLHELRFWLHIMADHALFIAGNLPCDRPDLIQQAHDYHHLFEALRTRAESESPGGGVALLAAEAKEATTHFLAFKRSLLAAVIQCRLDQGMNHNFALFLDHIAREAMEFLRLLDMMARPNEPPFVMALREEIFWLRIMKEHAKFIAHWLDPTERKLIKHSYHWVKVFRTLLDEARDLGSMLQARPETFPVVTRFTDEVITATRDLREFKTTAGQLISECKVLILASPETADHVAREASHFLEMITVIRDSMN